MRIAITQIIYVTLMVAIIVAIDVLFFRRQFLKRLIANVFVVLVFVGIYLLFIKHR